MLHIFPRNWRYLFLSLSLSWKCNELLQQLVVFPFMRASQLVLDTLFNAAIHLFSDSIVFSSLPLFPSVFTSPVITVISMRCALIFAYSRASAMMGRGLD